RASSSPPLHGSERLERNDRARVLNPGNGLHLLIDEMTDVGLFLDVKLGQQVELSRRGIDLGRNFRIGKLVGHVIGFAEMALDLDEKRDHALPGSNESVSESSKIAGS